MLITYLTIEDIGSGLFQTQVINIIEEIVKQSSNIKFEILVINRPWYIYSHLRHMKEIKSKINEKLIKIRYVPLLPPLRNAMKSYYYSVFVTNWLYIIFLLFISNKTSVLHCRSYWPAQAAIKSKIGPVLFDMRSLWPAENLSSRNLKYNSKSFQYWMDLERNCLQSACVSSGVSRAMVTYAEKIAPNKNHRLIPISVDMNKFRFNYVERSVKRKLLSWSDNIVLVYSGSFGISNINANTLCAMLTKLLKSNVKVRILFLTMETDEKVNMLMESISLNKERFHLVHPTNDNIASWLSVADIGIHALPMQHDSETRLGTKVVEYWANGLAVIVNEHVGAAAELIREHNVGAVIDDNLSLDDLSILMVSLSQKKKDDQISFAHRYFSTSIVANKYMDAYETCRKMICN